MTVIQVLWRTWKIWSSNSSFSKNLNVGNLAFSLSPEFNIPYSTSPVSLNLSPSMSNNQQQLLTPNSASKSKNNNKKRNYMDEDTNESMTEPKKTKTTKPGKQTKSQSLSVLSTPKRVPLHLFLHLQAPRIFRQILLCRIMHRQILMLLPLPLHQGFLSFCRKMGLRKIHVALLNWLLSIK